VFFFPFVVFVFCFVAVKLVRKKGDIWEFSVET